MPAVRGRHQFPGKAKTQRSLAARSCSLRGVELLQTASTRCLFEAFYNFLVVT